MSKIITRVIRKTQIIRTNKKVWKETMPGRYLPIWLGIELWVIWGPEYENDVIYFLPIIGWSLLIFLDQTEG